MTRKFHKFRRITGAALLIILIVTPFLRIGGQSAFRFDVPSLRLLFFGTEIWMTDFFIVLIAVLFLTFITLFTTTVFGRIWCGWLCPQTVLSDATEFARRAALERIDVRLHVRAQMAHAWPLFHPALPAAGGAAIREAGDWIAGRLGTR